MGDLSFHFSTEELKCKCGCGKFIFDSKLIGGMEFLRARFMRPEHVLSGTRCESHNANVGGVGDSQHLYGKAADIYFDDIPVDSIAQAARQAGFIRIGIYYKSNPPFVHVDTSETAPQGEWNDN